LGALLPLIYLLIEEEGDAESLGLPPFTLSIVKNTNLIIALLFPNYVYYEMNKRE
jgi:hypothetical protein